MPARPSLLILPFLLLLQACVAAIPVAQPAPAVLPVVAGSKVEMLAMVAARVEPVATRACRARGGWRNCSFTVALADDPTLPANAFQTLDGRGRPVIVLTMELLDLARNGDELALVIGHESAHHIAGHIPRRQEQARGGAVVAGAIARASGLSEADIAMAQDIGAEIAARQYSHEFELEADALGAQIAWLAGYDPVRGAVFFARLPDPGNSHASSHPSMAERRAAVAQAVAAIAAAPPQP